MTDTPPRKPCPQCGELFTPWRSRWTKDGWVICCSTPCRRAYCGRLQMANGSHAKACQTRRLRCAERMAAQLKGLTMKQAYQLGWKRGYRRGRGVIEQLGGQLGQTSGQKIGRVS